MFTQDVEDMPWLQPEKASAKQMNFIKVLYKDTPESLMLEDIAKIISRKPDNLQDIFRDEASKIIEARKNANQSHDLDFSKASDKKRIDTYSCSNCGAIITQGVAAYSRNKYKKQLCENCQKKISN